MLLEKRTAMDAEKKNSFLSLFPLFSNLSDPERRRLAEMMEYRVKPRYNFLYMPGEPSDTIFFLARGTIKISTHSSDGKEIIQALVHPMAIFVEIGLIGAETRIIST